MTRDPAALLAAIQADPFDIELRRVYGDLLLDNGDPRGELIQLQLLRAEGTTSPESIAREKELIDRHIADWLGPIAAVAESFVFERGFLHRCVVPAHRKPYNVERVVGHESWSTVVEFEGPSAIYLHPVMRSLRSLIVTQTDGLDELCTGIVERPLRSLACELSRTVPPSYSDRPTLPPRSTFFARSLPQLETLIVDGMREPHELLDVNLGMQVKRLVLRGARVAADHPRAYDRQPPRPTRLPGWIDAANRTLRVPELELVEWRDTTLLRRGEFEYAVVSGSQPSPT